MSDIKRQAVQSHETADEARRIISESMPVKQYNYKIKQLTKAGILSPRYPPNPKQCSSCGAKRPQDQPDTPLLCCGAWVADYKTSHKHVCKKAQN
ncbi:hypothetical protein VTP01DRAFT_5667, partial [Rhizomucor pusillus]|uniref:uncharacterized protein n=1 Tax=Rhizomucor pusillus TaxID=4840 RepID=UPI0037440E9E